MDEKKLDSNVIWISGGASGMGAATARLAANLGAKLVIADIQVEARVRLSHMRREPRRRGAKLDRENCRGIWIATIGCQLRWRGTRLPTARVQRSRMGPFDGGEPEIDLLFGQARLAAIKKEHP